ncbi:hypothetical protein [Ornithobacterium rhinotracheale]|uniref:Uncharacterized protein n=2 Tax=Ornithobacterium rhinotracheale TaxID=28251 RepID=I3ZXY9_ORNRL|nr:hypothetical protein [Ornithobacterium rhinotracheale]AFL96573.1 hypothetical protein Ornrh_0365 [Ornithobacterium rhinotracheale DSM 15997]AIQ00311.1 hypothetical protein Q785_01955 [Ornithobacterium rhinotracheale ORT-UMN 88]KGB67881.1 hypothetical protein Q787_01925 [Ornithobacterium rhinotracheale H06-030791]MCK0194897.1 hypothetical protein [Ornithobacterium rhinotracheale]MCK0200167.1 hypothetical protein [Ornithobacterium rhinotracheale]
MKERVEEMKEDRFDLYNRARFVNPHKYGLLAGKGAWVGHVQQAEELKRGLKANIIDYEISGYNTTYKNYQFHLKMLLT